MEKRCNYCGYIKDIKYFYVTKRKDLSNYIHSRCYECEKQITNKRKREQKKIIGSNEYIRKKLDRKMYRPLNNCKRRAKINNWECDLDINFINEIRKQTCIYCGYSGENMSIDRKDNTLGYLKSNCVPSCFICNAIKNSWFTFDEMVKFGKLVKKIRSKREIPIKLFVNRNKK